MNASPRADGALGEVRPQGAVGLFFDLFKLRIGLVIGFTAFAGLAVAPGPAPAGWRVALLVFAVVA